MQVLEGVGLLKKKSKNIVHWVPSGDRSEANLAAQAEDVKALTAKNKKLQDIEASLDCAIQELTTMMEQVCVCVRVHLECSSVACVCGCGCGHLRAV